MEIGIALIASYIIGSFSPSILLVQLLKGVDIRQHGSGNAGSTNTARLLGKKVASVVMLIDIIKGVFAVYIGIYFGEKDPTISVASLSILCGITVVIGHIWTVFHQFKGGKGVNTSLGVFLCLMPIETILVLIIFLLVLKKTGYVSLGSMISSIFLPIILILRSTFLDIIIPKELVFFTVLLPVLIIVAHKSNIKRLIQKTENRSSFFSSK